MHEGTILPESPLASLLTSAEVQARQQSFEARRGLLRTNPALYISRTRLAIRQIPLFVNERMLRRLAGWAIKAFNNDVKQGRRSKLTLEELKEPENAMGQTAPKKGEEKANAKAAAASAAAAAAEEHDDDDEEEDDDDAPAGADKTKKKKKAFFKQPSKVKQAKILRQEDRVDPLTGQKRSKGYGFVELNSHADALRVVRWANANDDVFDLFRTWWIEDLKSQIERLKADPKSEEGGKDAKVKASKKGAEPLDRDSTETRLKRLQEKLVELEAEEKKATAATATAGKGGSNKAASAAASTKRQGKTLIIEFSIENAMTVKRREEKADKSREREKKRKRVAEDQEGGDEEDDAAQEKLMKKQEQAQAQEEANKKAERNPFGSMIGKKRKIAKARKGGK